MNLDVSDCISSMKHLSGAIQDTILEAKSSVLYERESPSET